MEFSKFDDESYPEYQAIRIAMKLLFLRDDVIEVMKKLDFNCQSEIYCLTHHLIGIAKQIYQYGNKFSSIIWSVTEFLKKYYQDEADEMLKDPVELLKVLLIHLHSAFRYQNCSTLDWDCNQIDSSEYYNNCEMCSMHTFFSLMIYENHRCSSDKDPIYNAWEKHTICQFFHLDLLFDDLNVITSQVLAGYPPFVFEVKRQIESGNHSEQVLSLADHFSVKDLNFESNALKYKNKLAEFIKKSLNPDTASACFMPGCENNSQNFSVVISNQPKFFMIQILSKKEQISHLDSLLSTVSISFSTSLADVYVSETVCKYQLLNIVFSRDSDTFFTFFKDGFWQIEGFDGCLNPLEFLVLVIIMNLVPYIIVYAKTENVSGSWPDDSHLLFLEQVATQTDWTRKEEGINTKIQEFSKAKTMMSDVLDELMFNIKIAEGNDYRIDRI